MNKPEKTFAAFVLLGVLFLVQLLFYSLGYKNCAKEYPNLVQSITIEFDGGHCADYPIYDGADYIFPKHIRITRIWVTERSLGE
jgi:hypothetical protein